MPINNQRLPFNDKSAVIFIDICLCLQSTGASIQVASEMLPSSTERAVTISGTPEAITKAVHHVCRVMLEVS